MTAVHQLLPVFSYGDAIGNATLRTQVALRSLGFNSLIFADVIDKRLKDHALPADALPSTLGAHDGLISPSLDRFEAGITGRGD